MGVQSTSRHRSLPSEPTGTYGSRPTKDNSIAMGATGIPTADDDGLDTCGVVATAESQLNRDYTCADDKQEVLA